MYAVIDRIEEGIAVLEFDDVFILEIPVKYIDKAKEGKGLHSYSSYKYIESTYFPF